MAAGKVCSVPTRTIIHIRGTRNKSENSVHTSGESPAHADPYQDYHRRGVSLCTRKRNVVKINYNSNTVQYCNVLNSVKVKLCEHSIIII